MSSALYQIQNSPGDVIRKRAEISRYLLAHSENINNVTLSKIAISDLELLFQLYNQIFFMNCFDKVFRGQLKFSFSRRLTKSAGKTLCPKNIGRMRPEEVVIEIRIGLDFFPRYNEVEGDKMVSGILTHNPLEALQIVFEHELCHVIEFIYFHHSSCRGKRFKNMARNIFGHTSSFHQLPTEQVIAREKYGLKLGNRVSFQWEGKMLTGLLYNINKRATVMVRDKKGIFLDRQGRSYSKYYVPVNSLQQVSKPRK